MVCFIAGLDCTSVRLGVAADRSIRTPASGFAPSATQYACHPEEHRQVGVVAEYAIDQLPTGADDLAGNLDEGVEEGLEFHPQNPSLFRRMLVVPTSRLGQPQCPPGLEVPGQSRGDHVRPIAQQIVHRGRQCPHATGQLGNQVLLVAAVVRLEDHPLRFDFPVIGDVEEVADLIEQPLLALLVRDVLAEDDHAVGPTAGRWLIIELGVLLALEPEDFVFPLADDPPLDVGRLPSRIFAAHLN